MLVKYTASDINMAFAAGFALAAHSGQKRKFTGEDYYNHPKRVCETLYRRGYRDNALISALLHDVVEDTAVTVEEIEKYFGSEVATTVHWLTKLEHAEGVNRAERKRIEAARLRYAPVIVKTIKLADRLDNMTILTEEPEFAPVFAAETRHLLDYALKEGDERIWAKVDKLVREFQQQKA